jgi:uncharacterized protein YfaQ (DUF2300 family)
MEHTKGSRSAVREEPAVAVPSVPAASMQRPSCQLAAGQPARLILPGGRRGWRASFGVRARARTREISTPIGVELRKT